MSGRKLYRRKVWGGFCDGRPYYGLIDTGFGGFGKSGAVHTLLIFTSKAEARKKFEDVRPLELRELPKPKCRRKRRPS